MVRVSASAWGVTIWQALLGLVTTPFLIHHLGAGQYGIFAVTTIVATYLLNLELGFGHATLQFVARARAAGNVTEEANVLGTSFVVFGIAGTAATGIALLGSSFVADHFVHGSVGDDVALKAIRLGALTLLGTLIASFGAVSLQGINRYSLVIRIRAVAASLSSAGSVITVLLGGELLEILVVQLVITAGLAVALLIALTKSSAFRPTLRVCRHTLVAMARYGVAVLIAGVAYQVLLQGPPTVLAGHSTTDQVAAYAVPSMIMQQLVVLLGAASFVFAPFASAQSIATDRTRLTEVFRSNVRLTILVAGPIVAFLWFLGEPVVAAWINPSFAHAASGPLRFLAVAALALAVSAPSADVMRGLGRPSSVAVYTVVAAAIALVGAFLLVGDHGATGVAAALGVALALTTSVFLVIVAEGVLELPPRKLLRALSGPLVAAGIAAGLFSVGAALTEGFGGAVATGVVGSAIYALVAMRWVLDERERGALAALRPRRRGQPSGDIA
jgi:O-antigen/teichoic acid export membrane protein